MYESISAIQIDPRINVQLKTTLKVACIQRFYIELKVLIIVNGCTIRNIAVHYQRCLLFTCKYFRNRTSCISINLCPTRRIVPGLIYSYTWHGSIKNVSNLIIKWILHLITCTVCIIERFYCQCIGIHSGSRATFYTKTYSRSTSRKFF